MEFKYSNKIIELGIADCPPFDCTPMQGVNFYCRWVHADIRHKDNFIPVLEIKPERFYTPQFAKDSKKCSGFALSMHDSLENSIKAYENLIGKNPKAIGIIGTHVALLTVKTGDGYKDKIDRHGHFNFFEAEAIDWVERVVDDIVKIVNK